MRAIESALQAWRELLGQENARSDAASVRPREQATFRTEQKILAVLYPANRDEVRASVQIANRFRIPLYPVSGGRNWGYGSSVPVETESVLIDLSRMNRILEFDETLAFVRVEPGVTQWQLEEFLRSKGGKLWIDPTSSSRDASLIGNALERGHGMTPYADHVAKACRMEVVLPTGELIETGFGHLEGSKVANFDPWPAGPALDGLFIQSNLGIVTAMTFWLMPRPAKVRVAFLNIEGGKFIEAVDILVRLRLSGTLRMGPWFLNDCRIIQSCTEFPWEKVPGNGALPDPVRKELRQKLGISEWMGVVGLFGEAPVVDAVQSVVDQALEEISVSALWLEDSEAQKESTAGSPLERFRRRLVRSMCGMTAPSMSRPYWRKRTRVIRAKPDLDQDRCGILWIPVSVPAQGAAIQSAWDLASSVIRSHGFEADVGITMVRERAAQFYLSIVFDRDRPGEDEAALVCQRALITKLEENGIFPVRNGIHTMSESDSHRDSAYQDVLDKLKHALDPNEVLAPGRYIRKRTS